LAELPIRELQYGFGEAMQLAAKNGRGADPHSDARVLPIIGPRIGATSAGRLKGDIRDSGFPADVRTANFRTKSRAQDDWRRTRHNKFTRMN
jgi:hypothetical protein